MCQLCNLKQAAARDRWPKPVEEHKTDINFLVDVIHNGWEAYTQSNQQRADLPVPEGLLEQLRLLADLLETLEEERLAWWKSPKKRALRQELELDGQQRKLSNLHNINNTTKSSIESLTAKVGLFVKWSLGMNGGVWELMNAHKINSGRA